MTLIEQMGQAARIASRQLATAGELKNDALKAIAGALRQNADKIIEANKTDLENGKANGLSASLLTRSVLMVLRRVCWRWQLSRILSEMSSAAEFVPAG